MKTINILICISIIPFMIFNSWRLGIDIRGFMGVDFLEMLSLIYNLVFFGPIIIILGCVKILQSKFYWLDIFQGIILIILGVVWLMTIKGLEL